MVCSLCVSGTDDKGGDRVTRCVKEGRDGVGGPGITCREGGLRGGQLDGAGGGESWCDGLPGLADEYFKTRGV